MSEIERIAGAWRRCEEAGEPAVLATVTRVAGSTYRRPGARMLFTAQGASVGLISGGCLEADLAERAGAVLRSGSAETVVYDMRSPDDVVWGLGLGCVGEVRVLLERLTPGPGAVWLGFVSDCARTRSDVALATVVDTGGAPGVALGSRACIDGAGRPGPPAAPAPLAEVLLRQARACLEARSGGFAELESAGSRIGVLGEFRPPPVALIVCGAGADAAPVVRLAKDLGWRVSVIDHRPDHVRPERFPGADALLLARPEALAREAPVADATTAVVVMTHHFPHDVELVRHWLASPAPYVGLLGPRRRAEQLLAELRGRGAAVATAEAPARLYAPVGLDLGADTPEEIALAVVAEIRAVLAGRPGGMLRDRQGPLHARTP